MENVKNRNPLAASALSLVSAGLGQLYNGDIAKAVIMAAIYMVFPFVAFKAKLHYTFFGFMAIFIISLLAKLSIIAEAFITARRKGKIQLLKFNRWYFYLLFIAAAFSLSNFTTSPMQGLKTYTNPSISMGETITPQDRIMADNNYYNSRQPQRGDVVVFRYPRDTTIKFMKRIVALDGDRLEIKNGDLLVNGQRMNDSYHQLGSNLASLKDNNFGPVTIPKGQYFVMGDNPASSDDSRTYGPVDGKLIEGKVLYIYWSEDKKRIGRNVT